MTPPDEPVEALVVRRLLPAPREQVFAAWLDPESVAQWMCPGDITSARVEIDPRVGGKLRIVMMRGQKGIEHWGEYLVIEPPSRLSFTWISEFTDRLPSVVTIELLERGARTELVLTHRRLPDERRDAHRQGWTDIVRKLEAALTPRPAGG
ncbi:MAG TPA: SRPBCC domain-containing protein [Gemmatimonadales bacterium]